MAKDLYKYVWVIETILREGLVSYETLDQMWRDTDFSGGKGLPKRTLEHWIHAIGDIFHIDIVNERKGRFRYYIENPDELKNDMFRRWMFKTISVSNTLSDCLGMRDRILLEDIPSGQLFLQDIVRAMKMNRKITVTYQSYWKKEPSTFDAEPYCVKLFKQRWYLVAKTPRYEDVRIYALDRICRLGISDGTFAMPEDWDAVSFFNGCFGIVKEDVTVQEVRLKVSANQANYLRDLPLHDTQYERERNSEYSIFSYMLSPTYDFQQEIMWHGEEMEVVSPAWLRKEIAGKVRMINDKYKEEKL